MHAYVHTSFLSLSLSRLAVTINHNSPSFLFASAEKSLGGLEGSFEVADGTKGVVFFRGKSFRLSIRYDTANEGIHDETLLNYECEISNTNLIVNIDIHDLYQQLIDYF